MRLEYLMAQTGHCSALGLCTVFWRSVPCFARLINPLNEGLEEDQTKQFGSPGKTRSVSAVPLKGDFIKPAD